MKNPPFGEEVLGTPGRHELTALVPAWDLGTVRRKRRKAKASWVFFFPELINQNNVRGMILNYAVSEFRHQVEVAHYCSSFKHHPKWLIDGFLNHEQYVIMVWGSHHIGISPDRNLRKLWFSSWKSNLQWGSPLLDFCVVQWFLFLPTMEFITTIQTIVKLLLEEYVWSFATIKQAII